ncbi:universal stress protein [Paraburkholderia sp. J67]|uniref:universal stress protein n=1 Tax=Paraburkholderia sp. J67 TaxID=2805435 RepID=UPI002ABD3E76|nr:universal stress protein [Paraburkholderia sp. J67]
MTTHANDSMSLPVISNILVAVDASPASAAALQYLRSLLRSNMTVHIVSVAEDPRSFAPFGSWTGQTLDSARSELRRDAEESVNAARSSLDQCGARVEGEVIDLCKEGGNLVEVLDEVAKRYAVDLVVLGSHQHRRLIRWVLGEVCAPFTHLLRWPVLIIPAGYEPNADERPSRILFATDGSNESLAALPIAARLATRRANWRVIYVVDHLLAFGTGSVETRLEEALREVGNVAIANAHAKLVTYQQGGWHIETAVLRTTSSFDDIPHALKREALRWNAQLLVVGTHGRRGLTRWLLGSVAERMTRLTSNPMLLVPPET